MLLLHRSRKVLHEKLYYVVFRIMTKPICRDSQIEMLSLYLGLSDDEDQEDDEVTLPEVLLVQGVGGTGKTVTLQWIFSHYFINHAVVDCIECYQPKLIFQVMFLKESIQLHFIHSSQSWRNLVVKRTVRA